VKIFSLVQALLERRRVDGEFDERLSAGSILGSSFFFLAEVGCPFQFAGVPLEEQRALSAFT
jgi:hypothetical protein